jgi:hypothetical protein
MQIYTHIGGWGGESNREIDFGFVSCLRAGEARRSEEKLCGRARGDSIVQLKRL